MASSMSLASRRRPATSVKPAVRRASLHWQLFLADALVLIAATAVLVLAPVRVSTEVVLTEVLVLSAGVAVMLALHLVLLRRTLAPLRLLTDVMGTIDLRQLGRRVPTQEVRAAELAALADAFNAMLDRLEDERRQSVRRALAAQEDERLRIARELHDQVGQTLTALTIQAERAAQPPGPPDPQVLEHIAHTALQSLDDVRRIGRELRPEALDDLGLVNALIALCRRLAAQSATRVTHQLRLGAAVQISPDVELVIYRVAQEAITNALRHAAATRIDVTLHGFAGGAQLIVSDDGRGLPPDLPDDTAGLTGMRERALLVSGELTLHARPHGGTEVRLTIPAHAAGA
jgi:two-component system sensor histidine kinase UhpB